MVAALAALAASSNLLNRTALQGGSASSNLLNRTALQGGSVPRTLSLRGHPGLCLDAPGNPGAGDLIQLWECNGHTNQLWLFDDGAYKIQYFADPTKCLDAGDM